MINFICKKKFLIRSNQVSLHSESPDFLKIPIEVDHPVFGLHIIKNLAEEKINMTPVNMSKSIEVDTSRSPD